MFVIGLTGGIGSGKTEASKILESFGAWIINADTLGHGIYRKNTKAWTKIVEEFGDTILDTAGNIIRSELAKRVFSSKNELDKLNNICHPEIKNLVITELNKLDSKKANVVVVEAAILIEANWQNIVDEVWLIDSKTSNIFDRVKKRDKIDDQAIKSRIDSQMNHTERSEYADEVITNNGTIDELRNALAEIYREKFISLNKE